LTQTFHPAYFETRFRTPVVIHDWPAELAIITAWPTTDESWSDDLSRAADQRLAAELRALGVWMVRITGYSPTTDHAEPGWAAALPFHQACDIGIKFQQDAIYYVSENALWVSHCDSREERMLVGEFRERVEVESC
jgi:Protein of unknown function (DUF3293)